MTFELWLARDEKGYLQLFRLCPLILGGGNYQRWHVYNDCSGDITFPNDHPIGKNVTFDNSPIKVTAHIPDDI